jgi:hypothetical protein
MPILDDPDARTDVNGRFELTWQPRRSGMNDSTVVFLARDVDRNLAVAQDIDEDTGTLDLKLEPGLTLMGRVECDGKPLTNAAIALVFWYGNTGMHLTDLSRGTQTPGQFEIPALPTGRKYGVVASAKGYGQKAIHDLGLAPETRSLELDPLELKPANLRLAGQVLDADDKPISGASVNLSGDTQPNANTRTDRQGRFSFENVCEGAARLFANFDRGFGNTSAEGGDTNVVLRLGESMNAARGSSVRKFTGTVTGPDGVPVPGAQVSVFPNMINRGWTKTDTNGSFKFTWTAQPQTTEPLLVIRHEARNLGATEVVGDESTNFEVRLKPALTVIGRVEATNAVPLTHAEVGVWLKAGNYYTDLQEKPASVDAEGRFEIKALPVDVQYIVYARAKGYGRSQQNLTESDTNQVELAPFILKPANLVLAGQVLNADEKPVSGVFINLSGEGQPQDSVVTDSKGRFKANVCEGQIRVFASGQTGFAQVTADAGDTNLVIHLASNGSPVRPASQRVTLTGKPLPDLKPFGFEADALGDGKPVLLCLLDIDQRPCRRLARLLADQHDALRQKGIVLLAIQAAESSEETFKAWKLSNPLTYPVGRAADKSENTKWASQVPALPWLILADRGHRIVAEGFPVEELDAILKNALR